MRKMPLFFFNIPMLIFTAVTLAGCATTTNYKDVITTQMAQPLKAQPANEMQKTVYVQVRNSSHHPDLNVEPLAQEQIKKRGYKLVQTADKAHFLVEANIVEIGESNLAMTNEVLAAGYGANTKDNLFPKELNSYNETNDSHRNFVKSFGKKTNYSVLIDLQLSKRTKEAIREPLPTKPDEKFNPIQAYFNTSHWIRTQTRLISTAQETRMDYESLKPLFEKAISQTIAEIFPQT